MHLQIEKIWPRFPTFSLRSFLPRRLLCDRGATQSAHDADPVECRDDFCHGLLRDGEILINRVNSIQYLGKTALVEHLPEATVFESNMMRLTIDQQRMLPDFALLILTSPAASGHFLRNAKLAIAQASINQHDVNSLWIQRPHLEEQGAICERIAAIDGVIRNTVSGLEKLHRTKTALMHDLLTGHVSVTPLLTQADVYE